MSRLKAVDPKAAEPSKAKILIYGKPGVGKTWTALDFPAPYYIDTEGGADLAHYTDKLKRSGGAYLGPQQESGSFETILDQVRALATERHLYKTLIVDSISKVFQDAIAFESERLGDKNSFGADKKPAVGAMRRLLSWFTRLDMNVILIAHEKPVWGRDEKGNVAIIDHTFDAYEKVEYELHLCLQIIKRGPERNARVRKTRLTGFADGDMLPWSYPEFASRFGRDTMEREAQTIILASAKQISEIEHLRGVIVLPDGQFEKWLKAVSADTIADMTEVHATKLIAKMRGMVEKEAA